MPSINGNKCPFMAKENVLDDFVRPDLPSKCTWKPNGDKTKTVHTIRPL